MKVKSHIEIIKYTYNTKAEREDHINKMEKDGWKWDEKGAKLFKDSTSDDYGWYGWYACFIKNSFNGRY